MRVMTFSFAALFFVFGLSAKAEERLTRDEIRKLIVGKTVTWSRVIKAILVPMALTGGAAVAGSMKENIKL
jgi:hypothetical protein